MSSEITSEQRAEWRREHYGWDSTCEEVKCGYVPARHHPTCVECGIPLDECPVLALLDALDAAEAALARIKALAEEWEQRCEYYRGTGNFQAHRGVTSDLRAALTEPGA